MPTEVRIKPDTKEVYIAKEGYGTIKKRLWDSRDFIEVTFEDGRKVTINKMDIRCAGMVKVTKYVSKKKK